MPSTRALLCHADWDEQRRDYIKKHPKCNQTRKGKPKMFMITGSHMSVCGNDVGDFLNLKSLKNKLDYCDPREIPVSTHSHAWRTPSVVSHAKPAPCFCMELWPRDSSVERQA